MGAAGEEMQAQSFLKFTKDIKLLQKPGKAKGKGKGKGVNMGHLDRIFIRCQQDRSEVRRFPSLSYQDRHMLSVSHEVEAP